MQTSGNALCENASQAILSGEHASLQLCSTFPSGGAKAMLADPDVTGSQETLGSDFEFGEIRSKMEFARVVFTAQLR